MSMVLNGKYRDVPIRAFYLSRILRLYPVYATGAALALVVAFGSVAETLGQLQSWGPAYFVLSNLLIVGQDLSYVVCVPSAAGCGDPYVLSLDPPAWSLSVELGFYAIAPFVVRSPRRTFWFIGFGLAFLAAVLFLPAGAFGAGSVVPHLALQDPFELRYYFYASSAVFFGLGALVQQLSTRQAVLRYWPLIALAVVAMLVARTPLQTWEMLVFAAALPIVFRATARNRWDRRIGELSYPVYILHFPVLLALRSFAPPTAWAVGPLWLGTTAAVICIVAGWIVHITVESAVGRIRGTLVDRSRRASIRAQETSSSSPGFSQPGTRTAAPVAVWGAAVTTVYLAVPVLLVVWILTHQAAVGAT